MSIAIYISTIGEVRRNVLIGNGLHAAQKQASADVKSVGDGRRQKTAIVSGRWPFQVTAQREVV